jgi:hypothetical protein
MSKPFVMNIISADKLYIVLADTGLSRDLYRKSNGTESNQINKTTQLCTEFIFPSFVRFVRRSHFTVNCCFVIGDQFLYFLFFIFFFILFSVLGAT